MGFQERDYYGQQQTSGYGGGGGGMLRIGLPRLTRMVKYLLLINFGAFFLQMMLPGRLEMAFALFSGPAIVVVQVWRLITFQFLHRGLLHIFMNMLALYFLGPTVEGSWGSKRFLTFYLVCGAVGGLVFLIGGQISSFFGGALVGASGGILGLLVACAILFPHFVVFIFVFPVPIRLAAVGFTLFYVLNVISKGYNAGGDLCHLGGMATAFVWIMGRPYWARLQRKFSAGSYRRKSEQEARLQFEVDRILTKVHEEGIHSLSRREKNILQKATEEKRQG